MPEPPRRWAPTPADLALAALCGILVFGYPVVLEQALGVFGVRSVGAAVLGTGLLSLAWLRRAPKLARLGSPLPAAALLALPALAAATGARVFLLLMPAAVQALLAALFLLSLRGGGSLLHEAALWIHPLAPDFIGPYCRKATAVFAALFALEAVAAGVLAIRPPQTGWAFASSAGVWIPVALATAVEWIVRKAWFRYYGSGPVDRLLRALLPPEGTTVGRRSLEYVRRMRRELGMPPP